MTIYRFFLDSLIASVAVASSYAFQVNATDIIIGVPSGFSGPAAGPVKEMVAGAQIYFDHINARGGVAGNRIRLEFADDAFDPKRTADAAQNLIEVKFAIALFLTRGTPNSLAVIPILRKTGTPLIAPSSGAVALHEPANPLIFNVRTKYQVEAERAILQLVTSGSKRIAVIHVDDTFGKDALTGFQNGFKKTTIAPLAIIVTDRTNPDVASAIFKLKEMKPQAVVLAASAKQCAEIIKASRLSGSNAYFVALSNVSSQAFVDDLGKYAHGVQVMQVFPDPSGFRLPLTTEFRNLAQSHPDAHISHAAMEGFVAAKILVEGLRRAGRRPTKESLVAGLSSIKDFDLGGLRISYSINDRVNIEFAEPSIISRHGKFVQ